MYLAASIVSYYVLKGAPQQETFIANWLDEGRLNLGRIDESDLSEPEPNDFAEVISSDEEDEGHG